MDRVIQYRKLRMLLAEFPFAACGVAFSATPRHAKLWFVALTRLARCGAGRALPLRKGVRSTPFHPTPRSPSAHITSHMDRASRGQPGQIVAEVGWGGVRLCEWGGVEWGGEGRRWGAVGSVRLGQHQQTGRPME